MDLRVEIGRRVDRMVKGGMVKVIAPLVVVVGVGVVVVAVVVVVVVVEEVFLV